MINKIFKLVPNFKSGLGQQVKNKIEEVKVVNVTLKRREVAEKHRILNNHHGVKAKIDTGEEVVYMFTTKEKSKSLIEGTNAKYESNDLISSGETISGNKDGKTQFLSRIGVKYNNRIMNLNDSEKAEIFVKNNAEAVAKSLNNNFSNNIIDIKVEDE